MPDLAALVTSKVLPRAFLFGVTFFSTTCTCLLAWGRGGGRRRLGQHRLTKRVDVDLRKSVFVVGLAHADEVSLEKFPAFFVMVGV